MNELSAVDMAQATYLRDLLMADIHGKGLGCGNCRTPWGVSKLWCRNDPSKGAQ